MSARTLLLNPWMMPHKIISWQDAITMMYLDKVEVLEAYDEEIISPSVSIRMPAVVRLKRAVGSVKRGVKFSRTNVFTRDGYRCQYCGEKKRSDELNYDHVVPRVQGGKTVWDNIVTACYPCNNRKRNRTPEQAGMALLSKPVKPRTLPIAPVLIDTKRMPEAWSMYCAAAGAA